MDIIKVLSIIKDKCNNFEDIPEHMQQTIKKEDMINYLKEKTENAESEINYFISIIYDEVYINITYRLKKIEKI